jgi:GWxTD domain-containing protein
MGRGDMKRFPTVYIVLAMAVIFYFGGISGAIGKQVNIQAGITLFPDPRIGPEVYVEFPFAIHRNQLAFLPGEDPEGGLLAGVYAQVLLIDTLGNAIDSSKTSFYTSARDTLDAQDEDVRLFNRLSMMIAPGIYSANLTVIDIVGKGEGSFLYDRIEVEPIVDDHLNLSNLELAYRIKIIEDSSIEYNTRLLKNSREVIPNPMAVFSEEDSAIYIYAELYNLQFDEGKNDSFSLHYQVFESDGMPYFDYGKTSQIKPGSSSVITNALDVSSFEPGKYDLSLIVDDFSSGMSDTTVKRFFIFPKAGQIQFATTVTRNRHPYDTAGVQTKMNLVKFLMAPQQLAMLETLNDTGKVRFIDQFFRDKDPDPATGENEYLNDVINRYVYAVEEFSILPGGNDGWRSDRGRVLMQYALWDEREEALVPSLGSPWELWIYHSLQGGILFVFADISGYGDFRLVHSTARGEVFSNEWNTYLKNFDPKIFKEGIVLPGFERN